MICPSPFMSLMFCGYIEKGRDISLGCQYNNFGIHGTGVAPAADSCAAVKRLVFDEGMKPEKLIEILDLNYEGYDEIHNEILSECPKMGNGEDFADEIAARFLSDFANALKGIKNERGGIYRAGTGTAMYYVTHAVGATADGRKKGDFLPANYSPSLGIKLKGPFSIIKSFTTPDLKKTVNGGPLTLEFTSASACSEEGIKKIAMLVKAFCELGGHQIQLNVINKDSLIDAQRHPEKYRNLIVRVWGWSGYFVELHKEYQNRIIKRAAFDV